MKTKETQYLTQSDFNQFIKAIPNLSGYKAKIVRIPLTPEQFQLMYKLMYYCGLKTNEVLRLTKKDFDPIKGILKIKSVSPTKYKPQEATVPPIIINELQSYLSKLKSDETLFNITRSTVWKYIKEASHFSGVKLLRSVGTKEIRGGDTFVFRESLENLMTIKGADKNLIALKLRESEAPSDSNTFDRLREWEQTNFPRPSFAPTEIQSYVEWFRDNRDLYETLRKKAEQTVDELLKSEGISGVTITSSTKEIQSFKEKLEKGFPYNPKEMQDLARIRIIANVKSEVEKISRVIRKNFIINEKLSVDKFSELVNAREIGYQTKNFVVLFPEERTTLPEYKKFQGIEFEIQVRTILQHAWAEIEHDRYYKSETKLPSHIERNFNLLAASLELVDNQFEQIISEIDKFVKSKIERKKIGEYSSILNPDLLSGYLIAKFKDCNIDRRFGNENRYSNAIIGELRNMGIETIDDLDSIFNNDLVKVYRESNKQIHFVDILRHLMIIHDTEKYFKSSWPKTFASLDKETQILLEKCGVDLGIVSQFLNLK